MGEGNREIIARGYQAWNEDDLDGIVDLAADECEVHPSGAFPDVSAAYRGKDGFRQFYEDIRGAWATFVITPLEYVENGDRVLVRLMFTGTGRDGIELQATFAHLLTMRDGKGVRLEAFTDWDEALAALGSGSP